MRIPGGLVASHMISQRPRSLLAVSLSSFIPEGDFIGSFVSGRLIAE